MAAYLNRGIVRLFGNPEDFSEKQQMKILEDAIQLNIATGFYEKVGDKIYRCSRQKGIEEKKGKAAEEILSVWDSFGMNVPNQHWVTMSSVQIISPNWKSNKEKIDWNGESFQIRDNHRMSSYGSFLRNTYGFTAESQTSSEIPEDEKVFFLDFMAMLKRAENVKIVLVIKP